MSTNGKRRDAASSEAMTHGRIRQADDTIQSPVASISYQSPVSIMNKTLGNGRPSILKKGSNSKLGSDGAYPP